MLELSLNILPPSSNHALQAFAKYGRVIFFPSKSLKQLHNEFYSKYSRLEIEPAKAYRTEYEFYFPMYNKGNGLLKRKDLTNMIKYLEDTIFKVLYDTNGKKLDDCLVIESHQVKINSEEIRVVIRIFPV